MPVPRQISPAHFSCCLPCPREPNSAPMVPPPFISMSSTFQMQCFPEKAHSNSSPCTATKICTSLMAGSDLGTKHQIGIFLLLLLFALAFFPSCPWLNCILSVSLSPIYKMSILLCFFYIPFFIWLFNIKAEVVREGHSSAVLGVYLAQRPRS